MKIDLEQKSKELKELVSQFETTMFLGEISSMMQFISVENPPQSLKGLSSPLRQLYYLAGLNLTSTTDPLTPLRPQFTQEEWDKMKELINEIEFGYQEFFYPKTEDEVDEEWKMRRMIAMPTFLNYFNQGPLNYEEQVIERVIEYFTPFNTEIIAQFGIEVNDFIEIYTFIDTLPNKFLDEKINRKDGQSWEEFAQSMIDKGLRPDEWNDHMPSHFKELFQFMYDKGKMHRFNIQQLTEIYGADKSNCFLNALICNRSESPFLYYTEANILHSKPIFKVNDNEFQSIELKQIIHAIFNILFEFCTTTNSLKDKFYAVRGDKLEEKIENVFQKYFNNKATVYKSYYTTDGNEQDLLFLIDGGVALIVEAKASKRKEPRRDPDKAYPLILSNFDEVIQKGYDQAYRVKSKFLDKEILKLYSDQQLTKHIADINTKKYYHVFSIIVTLERFGQIQTDLSELLEIWDNDEFPLSICIDDLEIFLLTLTKLNRNKSELVQFLHLREKLHGKLICSDELEICGGFLNKKITYKIASQNNILALTPDLSGIFDDHYHKGGIGFTNEKNMNLKTDSKYHIIGR
jgi:hypothetical protein